MRKLVSMLGICGMLMLLLIVIILSNINENIVTTNAILKQRTTIDSLYIEHLKTCSFISNKDVKLGYDNYLQYKPN